MHNHWEHIWRNSALEDCIIISHKLCREMISSQWQEILQKSEGYAQGELEMCLANVVFENELYFPDDKIRLIYAPGHTLDAISILDEEEKVLNAGDNISDTVEEIVPGIYIEKQIYLDTLYKYREMDFDTCVSGHNIILGKEVIDQIIEKL